MIREATCLVELFEENIVPGAPLLGYLFRLGTPGMAYVWPLPFPCWLGLFSVDFFSFGTDWISAVQKQATFTFTGVTEH